MCKSYCWIQRWTHFATSYLLVNFVSMSFASEQLLICLPLNAHTCLVYAARIRGAVFKEHCVVSCLWELDHWFIHYIFLFAHLLSFPPQIIIIIILVKMHNMLICTSMLSLLVVINNITLLVLFKASQRWRNFLGPRLPLLCFHLCLLLLYFMVPSSGLLFCFIEEKR